MQDKVSTELICVVDPYKLFVLDFIGVAINVVGHRYDVIVVGVGSGVASVGVQGCHNHVGSSGGAAQLGLDEERISVEDQSGGVGADVGVLKVLSKEEGIFAEEPSVQVFVGKHLVQYVAVYSALDESEACAGYKLEPGVEPEPDSSVYSQRSAHAEDGEFEVSYGHVVYQDAGTQDDGVQKGYGIRGVCGVLSVGRARHFGAVLSYEGAPSPVE